MTDTSPLSDIQLQVMWSRLISVVEEQAQTLRRTAFSTAVREAGDLSAGVFDVEGRMIAQAVTGTPGHVNSMALSVGHFLARFPAETMEEGDIFVTNDPWMSTGHLFDFTVVTPTFLDGRIVALFASTAHVVDVGGIGFSADARQVFEEGLCIPPMHLARRGAMVEPLLAIVEANVREPVQVRGDLHSLAACNEIGCRRLVAMMREFGLADLTRLAGRILDNSNRAMLAAIAELPRGTWHHAMTVDGFEAPVEIVAAMTVEEDRIIIDFEGTSPVSGHGVNVPYCYTQAYASYGVRCLVGSTIMNNAGSLAPIEVRAPEGSILNAPRPAAVSARHAVGQMLPDVMFGLLHQILPDGAPAEGAASLWAMMLFGGPGAGDLPAHGATPFSVMGILAGGMGARPRQDGLSATAFPSRVRCVPIEISEAMSPIVVWRKELVTDSGGAGRQRGGLGQILEIENTEPMPFAMTAATCDRRIFPARGRDGGGAGALGAVRLKNGHVFEGKHKHTIPAGEQLVLELPGGGGLGDPRERERALVVQDVRLGLVSAEAAVRDYGLDPDALE